MSTEEESPVPAPDGPEIPAPTAWLLVASIFVAAIAGLIYELVAGTLSSYLLGDSVTQFSLVIGIFLTAMGIGSWLSGKVERDLPAWFVTVEALTGLTGGLIAPLAFWTFTFTQIYVPVLVLLIGLVGTLVGLEIPLMIRILQRSSSLRETLARVMAADYLGALAASLLFPFLLLPHLGLVRAGLAMGILNVFVAAVALAVFGRELGRRRRRWLTALVAGSMVVLTVTLAGAGRLVGFLESHLYQDEVVLAHTTSFQRVVLTRWRDDVRLYLDGHLQFASVDEYRYHECLVHVPMGLAPRRARVLILGGGDGLAAREVLRFSGVERVDLVDIDPYVTHLFSTRPTLVSLNGGSLVDPRVRIHNTDAMRFLEESQDFYDVVLMDLPDPSTPSLGKLYSRSFFDLLGRRMGADGVLATQATSPFRSREAFWCIHHTLEAARLGGRMGHRFQARGYTVHVPTFGTWGFVVAAARRPEPAAIELPVPTRFLTPALLPGLFTFPKDMAEVDTGVSELNDPRVTRLYMSGYHKYLE